MNKFEVAVFSHSPEKVDSILSPYKGKLFDSYCFGGTKYTMLKLKKDCSGRYWAEGENYDSYPRIDTNFCDQARVGDVDFTPNPKQYQSAVRLWEFIVEDQPPAEGESPICLKGMLDPRELVAVYGTKEEFALSQSRFDVFNIVTPNGTWRRRNGANIRFFGLDEDALHFIEWKNRLQREALNRLITEFPDLWVTLVTCYKEAQ